MAKKKTGVPFKAIEEVIKNEFRDEELVSWHDIDIVVKKKLSLEDMSALVSQVADACFDEAGDYHPEFKEFLYRLGIVTFCTDISLPKSSSKQFSALCFGDLFEAIERGIDEEFLFDLRWAISEKIDYKIKMTVEAINKRAIEQFNNFDSVITDLENIGSMLSDEDLKKLVETISSDKFEIDEGELAKAIVELRK